MKWFLLEVGIAQLFVGCYEVSQEYRQNEEEEPDTPREHRQRE